MGGYQQTTIPPLGGSDWKEVAMRSPCMSCGVLTKGYRCEECERKRTSDLPTQHRRAYDNSRRRDRGYDSAWRRLSARARAMQPFCSVCGATEDLQADHTPMAWERKERGLEVRLQDIQVLCGRCNRRAGSARGETSRRKLTRAERLELKAIDAREPRRAGTWGGNPTGHRTTPRSARRRDNYTSERAGKN